MGQHLHTGSVHSKAKSAAARIPGHTVHGMCAGCAHLESSPEAPPPVPAARAGRAEKLRIEVCGRLPTLSRRSAPSATGFRRRLEEEEVHGRPESRVINIAWARGARGTCRTCESSRAPACGVVAQPPGRRKCGVVLARALPRWPPTARSGPRSSRAVLASLSEAPPWPSLVSALRGKLLVQAPRRRC